MATAGASVLQDSLPHTANVAVHVLFGTLVLMFGLLQLLRKKGDAQHVKYGRWFLVCVWGSVATAAIGVVVFQFRAFLGVITLLVAYWAFSGYRALRIRVSGPEMSDALGSTIALAAAIAFVVYLRVVQLPWAPAVIYSTLGTLVTVALYDLTRFAFPKCWFKTLGVHEHIVKMIGAFGAALSAFSGTVFGGWQPYSQLVPSVLCNVLIVVFIFRFRILPTGWTVGAPTDIGAQSGLASSSGYSDANT